MQFPGYPFSFPMGTPFPYHTHQPYWQLEGAARYHHFNEFFNERDKIKQKLDKNTEHLNMLKKEISRLKLKNGRSQLHL